MTGGGSSGSGQNTVTQTTQIPEWQKDFAVQNEQIAASLASRPYPTYQGQLIADFTPQQQQGMQMTQQAANSYQPNLNNANQSAQAASTSFQPYMNNATNMTNQAGTSFMPYTQAATQQTNQAANSYQPQIGAATGMTAQAAQGWNGQTAQNYMSPYVQQSLAPQLAQLDIKQAQNRNQIAAGATQANAFGDARHGVADSLNNFYSGIERNGVIGQGYNTAYTNAQQAFGADQGRMLNAGGQMAQIGATNQQLALAPADMYGKIGQAQQGMQLQAGQQQAALGQQAQSQNLNSAQAFSTLAQQQQQQGLQGAEATFNMGTQQQQLNQSLLSAAYQNFMNQANWPTEQLNMRIAALANSPYSTMNQTTLAPANATAMNVGAFGALAGGVGSLLNGSGGAQAGGGGVFGGAGG